VCVVEAVAGFPNPFLDPGVVAALTRRTRPHEVGKGPTRNDIRLNRQQERECGMAWTYLYSMLPAVRRSEFKTWVRQ
jgi:hypothetical protein